MKERIMWFMEREIMMKMINMYIFPHGESTYKKTRMEWVMGLVSWEVDGV